MANPFHVANGREYAGEDEYLADRLEEAFDVRTCLPTAAVDAIAGFDAVVVRNSGPVATYRDSAERFRERALATGHPVYNELRGRGSSSDGRAGRAAAPANALVQPLVDIACEVSFYFVDHSFANALHTPDPRQRWDLEPYVPSERVSASPGMFIAWNGIEHGLQRVDACLRRTATCCLSSSRT